MASLPAPRPRVSSETRLLLLTVVGAFIALWVLARLRFPERDPVTNPVPAVLAPLAPPSGYDELALSISQLQPRLAASLFVVSSRRSDAPGEPPDVGIALRWRDGVAVMKAVGAVGAAPATPAGAAEILGEDGASDLAIVRVPPARVPPLETWSPRRLEAPRYLLSTDVVGQRVAWRPVYVGGLVPEHSPRWQDDVWIAPSRTDLTAGAFVFTVDGAWAGMAVNHRGLIAIAPPDVVMARAEGAIMSGRRVAATLGVEVAALTPPLAAAAGAESGVVVTWVDPAGPTAAQLAVTDVIETVDSVRLPDVDAWDARVRHLAPGDSLDVGGRRRGTSFTTRVAAAPVPAPPVADGLGLVLRLVRGAGATVVSVQPGAAAARAGIQARDTLTVFDGVAAPTPAQIARAYGVAPSGRRMLVGVSRGDVRLVLALEK